MTGDSDRLCPCGDIGLDTLYDYRCAEYCTVKCSTDSSVRRFPHLCKIVLRHSCSVRSDSCTLYSNAVLLCSLSRIDSYLILCLFTVLKTEVIVFCIELYIWFKESFLDPLPEYSCHLISVHFDERSFHSYFSHWYYLLKMSISAIIFFRISLHGLSCKVKKSACKHDILCTS